MEDIKELIKQCEQLRDDGAFLPTDAPKKIYCERDDMGNVTQAHNNKWPADESMNIEYVRLDIVEHIIGSAFGPQDALSKLRSL